MMELPPGRFSTTVGCPQLSESFCADMRVNGSRLPPGGKGVMKRTARVGYAGCAKAATLKLIAKPNASTRATDVTGSLMLRSTLNRGKSASLYALLNEYGLIPKKYGVSERFRACMEVIAVK